MAKSWRSGITTHTGSITIPDYKTNIKPIEIFKFSYNPFVTCKSCNKNIHKGDKVIVTGNSNLYFHYYCFIQMIYKQFKMDLKLTPKAKRQISLINL